MGVLNDTMMMGASAAGGYEIEQSLRFNDDDSAYLSRTPSVAGNLKTFTFSGWVKRGSMGAYQTLMWANTGSDTFFGSFIQLYDSDKLVFSNYGASGYSTQLVSSTIFRDPSAWYNFVIAVDTTQATDSNRVKMYVNGNQITSFTTTNWPALNYDFEFGATAAHRLGARNNPSDTFYDGYLAEVNFINGLALTPDSFGETGDYGEWKPLRYTGAYGTNGFYLDFADSGNLGKDLSINANNWTPTNLAATDQMLDSPTNNFCTLNPLDKTVISVGKIAPAPLSEGNLEVSVDAEVEEYALGTIGMASGKWYFEMVITATGAKADGVGVGASTTNVAYFRQSGYTFIDGVSTNAGNTTFNTVGDIAGVAYNADTGQLTGYVNNVTIGVIDTLNNLEPVFPVISTRASGGATVLVANFGQDSSFAGNKTAQGNQDANGIGDFYYAPPAGFLALCTQNLPDATVIPSEHFNTVLYTGDSSASRALTGIGFQPDFTWIKARSTTNNHNLNDSVRGANKQLYSNLTNAETSQTNNLKSFDSDGFTLGSDGDVNYSPRTYAAWNWKANGAGVSNTDGTITSTVSANVEAGFSIISYTGTGAAATVGHGLSVAPEMVIVKKRVVATSWMVYNATVGNDRFLYLDTTNAQSGTSADYWNNTTPSSSVVSLGNYHRNNSSSEPYISYAFHSVDGYSKFGSYTGNGSADGTFVHCGFRPAYVMIKQSSASGQGWYIFDNQRNEYNVEDKYLRADSSAGEGTFASLDLLSNGFKLRNTDTSSNSASTYIFLAFAESPFKHSNAR